jgi:DNA gyrase subunit A
MLLISENGYGKRTKYDCFTPHGRGTRGQIALKANEKTGELAGALSVSEENEIVCITSQGNTLKLELKQVPTMGRNASGVRIVNIEKPDFLVGAQRVVKEED